MIEVEQIRKQFGATVAVDGISFRIDRGEVVGFLGPNGAGKTTTMRILTGYLEPDEGRVRVDGRDLRTCTQELKRRLGYLPEDNPLYSDMLTCEFLEFVGRLRGLAGPALAAAIDDAVSQTGIAEVYYRPLGELSKGYRQRVGLAQAILHRPEILILDEPTEGLDPNQRVEIRRLITELGRERTVLLSTHVLAEVEETCGRLLVVHRGRLVADGTASDLVARVRGARRIVVELAAPDGAAQALAALPGVEEVEGPEPVDSGRVRFRLTAEPDAEVRPQIFELARTRNWVLWELHQEAADLESLFRELTKA
jgi:ABC-2 type transport system ATP-binding protein